MKATGIVRKIDDLGRVVIPKELRRSLHIRENDPLEIFTGDNGEVIFRKYSPLMEIGTCAVQYAEALYKTGGYPVVICDCDKVITVSGVPKREIVGRRVAYDLEDYAKQRKPFLPDKDKPIQPIEGLDYYAVAGAPVIASGDVCGLIMFVSDSDNVTASEVESKLITTAAAFLGIQMEI